MYAVTSSFLDEIDQSHQIATSVSVLNSGLTVASGLQVIGGSVNVDRTAQYRRSCSFQFVDATRALIPVDGSSAVSPYGNEVKLFRGVKYRTGNVELVPLGVFRIASSDIQDDGAQTVSVTGYDRSRTISRNRLTDVYIIASGTNYATAIGNLAQDRLPGVQMALSATTQTTPAIFLDPQADPWVEMTKMAQVIGMELFFDPDGTLVLRTEPVVTTSSAVANFTDDSMSDTLGLSKGFTDDPGYNGVIVTSETTSGTPARGEAWDTDPNSPTYYLGSYGKVPTFESSQYAVTAAQCAAAAQASLQRQIGGTEQLSLTILPNPALDASDPVTVTRTESGVTDLTSIDSLVIPLSADQPMSATMRRRRTVS